MRNTEPYELAEKEWLDSAVSIRELSEKYGVQREVFSGWMLAKGYCIENKRARRSFNTDYFDCIDSEEKAYWLGFLFADGSITQQKKSYSIELSLKLDDVDHVRKFAKAVGKEYVNTKSTYRCRCIIGSKHMFNTLHNYGCTVRKSLTLKFPDESIFADKSLIRHFIRGYVDGDGCLSYGNKQHTTACVSIVGTEDFLNGIQKFYGSNKNLYNNSKDQNVTKILEYSTRQAYEFAKWLYKDATIYLERKHEKYLDYCRLYQERYRILPGKNGESCNANTVVNSEIAKGSESPYSVETE